MLIHYFLRVTDCSCLHNFAVITIIPEHTESLLPVDGITGGYAPRVKALKAIDPPTCHSKERGEYEQEWRRMRDTISSHTGPRVPGSSGPQVPGSSGPQSPGPLFIV